MSTAMQSTAMPTAEQHGFRPHSDGAFVWVSGKILERPETREG